mgnify:CR=1 FL=1
MSFWLPSSKDIAHERMKALSDFVAGLIRIAILGALADATMTRFFESLTAAQGNYSFRFVYELFGLSVLTLVFAGLLVALSFHRILNAQLHANAWTIRCLASLRYSDANSLASFNETSLTLPKPISRRFPPREILNTH